eukprot:jgi/Chlat1/62/Chrsp1S03026
MNINRGGEGRLVCDSCADGQETSPLAGAQLLVLCYDSNDRIILKRFPTTDSNGNWKSSVYTVESMACRGQTFGYCTVHPYKNLPLGCKNILGANKCNNDARITDVRQGQTYSADICTVPFTRPASCVRVRHLTHPPTQHVQYSAHTYANPYLPKQRAVNNLLGLLDTVSSEPGPSSSSSHPRANGLINNVAVANGRTALDSLTALAGAYLLDSDQRKLQAAKQILWSITSLDSWITFDSTTPNGYLDLSYYTAAVAYGYDWLYSDLTSYEQRVLWNAIQQKAFTPALDPTHGLAASFTDISNNIALTAHAGFVIAALSFVDQDKDLCNAVLGVALKGLQAAAGLMEPGGAWFEGPMYDSAVGMAMAYALSALDTALGEGGEGQSLVAKETLREAAYFRVQLISPTGKVFSFSDSDEDSLSAQLNYYVAGRQGNSYLWNYEYQLRKTGGPFRVFWIPDEVTAGDVSIDAPPLDQRFTGWSVDTAFFRTSWTDTDAAYVAVKAGANPPRGMGHSHLDLGSFVYDLNGVRWFEDLGKDSYNLDNYFNQRRFDYYRTRTEGHNTLALSASRQEPLHFADQVLGASAPISGFYSSEARSHAIVDLSQAYAGVADSAVRGIALIKDQSGGGDLLVQDEVSASSPIDIVVQFHTQATPTISADGKSVVLRDAVTGQQLTGFLLSPIDGSFDVITCDASSLGLGDDTNAGDVNLVVRPSQDLVSGAVTVAVFFTASGDVSRAPAVVPLAQWPTPASS